MFLNISFTEYQTDTFCPEACINCKMILSFLREVKKMMSFDALAIFQTLIKEVLMRFLGLTSSYKETIS